MRLKQLLDYEPSKRGKIIYIKQTAAYTRIRVLAGTYLMTSVVLL